MRTGLEWRGKDTAIRRGVHDCSGRHRGMARTRAHTTVAAAASEYDTQLVSSNVITRHGSHTAAAAHRLAWHAHALTLRWPRQHLNK